MSRPIILVTGAGGFIGGRTVEVLHMLGVGEVRAVVRRWSTAAQIGRLPVEIVQADLLDATALRRAMQGVSAVVHCAVGDARATVDGTRNVLAAASDAGVGRVVHLSTIDVYGRAEGTMDETQPLRTTGAPYGDSKIAAEEVVREFQSRGLPVTILRPTIVYGPGSASWTVEFAQRLRGGTWMLTEADCSGSCNLVYVDDVVRAILRALQRPEPSNEAFNVNGAETITWFDYFGRLNDAMGYPALRVTSRTTSRLAATVMAPVRSSAKWALRRFPGLVMGLYQRSALARRLMKGAEAAIKQTPTQAEFRLYSLEASYPIEKARRELGYEPAFSVADGISLSAAWLHRHGFAPGD